MNRFLTWLGAKLSPKKEAALESVLHRTTRQGKSSIKPIKKKTPEQDLVEFDSEFGGRVEDGGPGKNVLVRNKYVREDAGTHESLKIIDDSLAVAEEEYADDPYNTGRFDRSQSWNRGNKK